VRRTCGTTPVSAPGVARWSGMDACPEEAAEPAPPEGEAVPASVYALFGHPLVRSWNVATGLRREEVPDPAEPPQQD